MFRYARLSRTSKLIHDTRISMLHPQNVSMVLQVRYNMSTRNDVADIGFIRSSEVSMSPSFTPFDANKAIMESVERNNVMSLWSLLEACLSSGYMDRAFSILQSLYQIQSHKPYFINDYNKYLLRYCEESNNIETLRKKLYTDLQNYFPDCNYDDRTLAIMLHHTLNSDTKVETGCYTLLSMSNEGTKVIMKHMDVLSLSDYQKLVNELKLVKIEEVPDAIKPLLNEDKILKTNNSEQITSESENIFNEEIRTLSKDAVELKAVNTFGMKTVRHSLLGLSMTESRIKRIHELSQNVSTSSNNTDETVIDFFQLYKSLETDEKRREFDIFLEEFNQDRQRELESKSFDAAKERWKHDFEDAKSRGDLNIKKSLNVKLWEWYNDMVPLMKEEINRCKKLVENQKWDIKGTRHLSPDDKARSDYAPYLVLVNLEKMCVITILELLKLQSSGGVSEGMRTARAVLSVGKAVEMEFRSETLLKSEHQMFKDLNRKSHEFKMLVQKAKYTFRNLKIDDSMVLWPYHTRAKIGSILISMLIHVAKVDVVGIDPLTKKKVSSEAPAFCHTFQYRSGSKVGVLKLHRNLINQLSGERMTSSVQPQHLPMLVKPRPWVNWNSGGYNYTQSTLIRSRDAPEQLAYLRAVSENGAIDNVYQGLNVLGETAWTVNKKLFNVISTVWNTGEEFLDIPPLQETFEFPPQPPRDADPLLQKDWRNKCKFLNNEFRNNRSIRCDSNYKLEIARAFLGEKFYFPHNMDFRGRAYPLAPHFNHLGNDMTRSLLIFWKGKKLGSEGFKWLKVHLANLYGMDKCPFEERIEFTEKNIENIKDSAENPLGGKRWWMKADKPWQCLATCIELHGAYQLKNPEEFISHQPVHQDGTCNGLQHYAALGGDIEGARQVNLVPSDRPQDVYTYVASLVKHRLSAAAKKGDEKAATLTDVISRKIVKRTVMTNVYGVTFVGAANQIDKELSELFGDRDESYDLSRYLAKHVFASIRELFHAAHLIQDWLGDCAKKISRSIRLDLEVDQGKKIDASDMMTSVIWTSPLGLPVVQPYRDLKKKQIRTNLQTVFITDPFSINPINPRRQMAGLPPNFIHSLDASHMLMSAIECGKHSLDFAAVHDSYWTHASDIPHMNRYLREQFIKLHEFDLIQRLKNEFDERYKDYLELKKIRKSSDLAIKVINMRKNFSEKLGRPFLIADEISMERERIRLLRSENPEEREKGKKMVTTISITEEYDVEKEEVKNSPNISCTILTPLKLSEIPTKGEFDVKDLVSSKYFFS